MNFSLGEELLKNARRVGKTTSELLRRSMLGWPRCLLVRSGGGWGFFKILLVIRFKIFSSKVFLVQMRAAGHWVHSAAGQYPPSLAGYLPDSKQSQTSRDREGSRSREPSAVNEM